MLKKTLILIISLLVLLTGTVGIGVAEKSDAKTELVLALTNLPTSLDPLQDSGLSALTTYDLLYDRLVDIDEKGNIIPSLALSWEPTGEKVWTIKLRKNVVFHNGENFDAYTVKSVIDRALTAPESKQSAQVSLISEVRVIDGYTVEIETKEPWALLVNRLSRLWMYPTKYFDEVGPQGFSENPIGGGEYKFVKWKQDDYLVLEKNENYWRKEQSGIKKITLRHTPDITARINAVQAGEADMAFIIDPEQAVMMEGLGYKLISQPIGQAYIYFFRTTLDSPLSDVRVRQAINYAVDKDIIVNEIFMGKTRKLDGQPVGPDCSGYNPNISAYPYDVEKAKKLLTEAGYPDGFTIDFDGTAGLTPKDKEAAVLIADQLSKVGITMKITLNERGVYLDKLFNAKMAPFWAISLNYAPTMDAYRPLNNATSFTAHKSNADPEFDAKYLKWLAIFNPEEGKVISDELLQRYHDDALALFLWQVPGVYVLQPNIEGIKMRPDYTIDLTNAVVK